MAVPGKPVRCARARHDRSGMSRDRSGTVAEGHQASRTGGGGGKKDWTATRVEPKPTSLRSVGHRSSAQDGNAERSRRTRGRTVWPACRPVHRLRRGTRPPSSPIRRFPQPATERAYCMSGAPTTGRLCRGLISTLQAALRTRQGARPTMTSTRSRRVICLVACGASPRACVDERRPMPRPTSPSTAPDCRASRSCSAAPVGGSRPVTPPQGRTRQCRPAGRGPVSPKRFPPPLSRR